jgi:hypothetical protein
MDKDNIYRITIAVVFLLLSLAFVYILIPEIKVFMMLSIIFFAIFGIFLFMIYTELYEIYKKIEKMEQDIGETLLSIYDTILDIERLLKK